MLRIHMKVYSEAVASNPSLAPVRPLEPRCGYVSANRMTVMPVLSDVATLQSAVPPMFEPE